MSEYTLEMWLIVYGASYVDCCAMLSNLIAFQNDSAGLAGLLSNIIVVYSFLGDIIIFQEKLNWVELVATMVILFTAFGVALYKLMEQRKLSKLEPKAQKMDSEV